VEDYAGTARASFVPPGSQEWSGWQAADLTVSVDQQVVASEEARDEDLMDHWKQVDVDLSAWTGREITLSLNLRVKRSGTTAELLVSDPVVYASEPDKK
jgi:hypothetical protein